MKLFFLFSIWKGNIHARAKRPGNGSVATALDCLIICISFSDWRTRPCSKWHNTPKSNKCIYYTPGRRDYNCFKILFSIKNTPLLSTMQAIWTVCTIDFAMSKKTEQERFDCCCRQLTPASHAAPRDHVTSCRCLPGSRTHSHDNHNEIPCTLRLEGRITVSFNHVSDGQDWQSPRSRHVHENEEEEKSENRGADCVNRTFNMSTVTWWIISHSLHTNISCLVHQSRKLNDCLNHILICQSGFYNSKAKENPNLFLCLPFALFFFFVNQRLHCVPVRKTGG